MYSHLTFEWSKTILLQASIEHAVELNAHHVLFPVWDGNVHACISTLVSHPLSTSRFLTHTLYLNSQWGRCSF